MAEKKSNKPPLKTHIPDKGKADAKAPNISKRKSLKDSDRKKSLSKIKDARQQILDELFRLGSGLSSIQQIIESRLSYDKTKEEAFNRLYDELEYLKRNSFLERNRSLFIDLILLFDRIENLRYESMQKNSTFEKLLKSLSDELLEILFRQGVQVINTPSPEFNPAIQRAIGTTKTTLKEKNNHVASTVRRGFKYQDHILRAEEVIVNKFNKP